MAFWVKNCTGSGAVGQHPSSRRRGRQWLLSPGAGGRDSPEDRRTKAGHVRGEHRGAVVEMRGISNMKFEVEMLALWWAIHLSPCRVVGPHAQFFWLSWYAKNWTSCQKKLDDLIIRHISSSIMFHNQKILWSKWLNWLGGLLAPVSPIFLS